MTQKERYFTLVFAGNIREFKGNPLETETVFGVPVSVGVGDAHDELERLHQAHDEEILRCCNTADRVAELEAMVDQQRRHIDLMAEMLAEIKASDDGQSEQLISDILDGGLAELNELYGLTVPSPRSAESA